MSRAERVAEFLANHGYAEAAATPLAQDASFRRYLRIAGGAVLMDAPAPEDVRPFLRIAEHVRAIGLSAPVILATDTEQGLLLEEDLGDELFSALLDREPNRSDLFIQAVDVLIALQRAAPPPGLPTWGAVGMRDAAMGTLLDWWWPAAFGGPAPAQAATDIAAALDAMLQPIAAGPLCFVHRDYFAGNLLWLPERFGVRRVGIIDFQGAALGHPAYDLASLLQDARRDIPDAAQAGAIAHYLRQRPEFDPASFMDAFHACAAQRHLRVACQWVRLALRDGKPHYLAYAPRTWGLLEKALTHPATAPLAAALNRWMPMNRRGNPPGLGA